MDRSKYYITHEPQQIQFVSEKHPGSLSGDSAGESLSESEERQLSEEENVLNHVSGFLLLLRSFLLVSHDLSPRHTVGVFWTQHLISGLRCGPHQSDLHEFLLPVGPPGSAAGSRVQLPNL